MFILDGAELQGDRGVRTSSRRGTRVQGCLEDSWAWEHPQRNHILATTVQNPSSVPKTQGPPRLEPRLSPLHVMRRAAGRRRMIVPFYSPHTPHRWSPTSPAVLHTVCSGSPRPQPRSSSCSPDGPPGAWKQTQSNEGLIGPGTTASPSVRLMVLTFSESWTLGCLMRTLGPFPRKRHMCVKF